MLNKSAILILFTLVRCCLSDPLFQHHKWAKDMLQGQDKLWTKYPDKMMQKAIHRRRNATFPFILQKITQDVFHFIHFSNTKPGFLCERYKFDDYLCFQSFYTRIRWPVGTVYLHIKNLQPPEAVSCFSVNNPDPSKPNFALLCASRYHICLALPNQLQAAHELDLCDLFNRRCTPVCQGKLIHTQMVQIIH